jgi:integrase
VTVAKASEPGTCHPRFMVDYRRYLFRERGLAEATLVCFVRFAEQFLSRPLRRWRLKPFRTLRQGCNGSCPKPRPSVKPGRAKLLVTALRSLLRYMRHQREIPLDLARCVLPVAMWSLSTLPRFLPAGTVQQLLDHHERETPRGKRNYAVLLLLARLGLRAFEIVALGLDDIDWDNGRITIHGKVDAWPRCRCHPTSVKPSQAICARPAMLYLSPSFPSTSSPRAWFCTLHHRLQHRETGADRRWRRFCSQGSAQD